MKYRLLLILLFVYFIVLFKLILFKDFSSLANLYSTNNYFTLIPLSLKRANFIPFKTYYYYISGQEDFKTGLENLGGNILLFIPLGFLFPAISHQWRKPKPFLLLSLMISFSFEFAQLVLGYGSFDVDDITLNVFGAWIGFIFFNLFMKLFHKYFRSNRL